MFLSVNETLDTTERLVLFSKEEKKRCFLFEKRRKQETEMSYDRSAQTFLSFKFNLLENIVEYALFALCYLALYKHDIPILLVETIHIKARSYLISTYFR